MAVKLKKKIVVKKTTPAPTPSEEPKEWKLTLHRGTNCNIGGKPGDKDNYARFGKTHESNKKSFGWIYVPLKRGDKLQTLEVRVIEVNDDSEPVAFP